MKERGRSIMSISKEKKTSKPDIPELDEMFWKNAVVEYPERKRPVTLRLDADILEWFRSTGKGYQTRINAVLRSYYEAHSRK
jgi:uncharacterized protein (DUF4415 family)